MALAVAPPIEAVRPTLTSAAVKSLSSLIAIS